MHTPYFILVMKLNKSSLLANTNNNASLQMLNLVLIEESQLNKKHGHDIT